MHFRDKVVKFVNISQGLSLETHPEYPEITTRGGWQLPPPLNSSKGVTFCSEKTTTPMVGETRCMTWNVKAFEMESKIGRNEALH